jgi:hypothetical protein
VRAMEYNGGNEELGILVENSEIPKCSCKSGTFLLATPL